MKSDVDVNYEPLPGYRLIEHIGAGGYGEVWRAEAPGGLTKAIKFVFGQQHEKRATNELRALDRVRGVRHPFLLSLERIEIIDGRLVVVTELADGSIKDRFDACRREGMVGIPREELLGYLRDAADALDFMIDSHALQHLDIKPENLLLLAGHVKVADFGLVKDVRQSQASMVGGMTPLYAAPEVFRGAPSARSDQYSLAIVFQEMLTGSLPFAGGNAAELTLQHLNDEPDLASLSASDRYTVSRALSKDPQHRHANCREFVDALVKAPSIGTAFSDAVQSRPTPAELGGFAAEPMRQGVPTDMFEDGESADWNLPPKQLLVNLPACDSRLNDLPPVDLTGRDARPVPTLVLGIGGAAGRVLSRLRKLIHDRHGAAPLPAIQLLLLDTDSRAISEVTRGDGTGLTADETLNLPLRRPQHYREHSQQLLTWLSRRWLYNIPRSLRTEGLRPLGRLALADHARQAGQRIRRAMMQARDAESLTVSSKSLGKEFRSDALRVYVVASISGGTGGGMSLDIGYAVRAILEKLGVAQVQVHGLMMHSTGGDPRHCELARVNAFSWLTEFEHFRQGENSYPGDGSCGFPAHPAGVPAFDDTYLLHLGENLSTVEFEQATHSVAEYLGLNALSPAAAFFDACREPASPENGTVRSFGLYQRTAAPHEFCDEFAGQVSNHVLSSWRTAAPAEAASAEPAGASQLVRRLQLDSTGIAANSRTLVELELGGEIGTFLSSWFSKQEPASCASEPKQLQTIDRIFGAAQANPSEDREVTLLGQSPVAIVGPFAEKLRAEIRRWTISRVDDPRERLTGARRGVQWLERHMRTLEADLQRLRRAVVEKLSTVHREIDSDPNAGAARGAEIVSQRAMIYFRLRLDHLATLAAEQVVQLLLCDVKGMSDEITALGREVDQIVAAVTRAGNPGSETLRTGDTKSSSTAAHAQLSATLQAKLPEIAAAVDAQLQAEYVNPLGGLLKVIMQGGRPRAQLTAKLHELCRQAVQESLAGVNVLESAMTGSAEQSKAELRSALAAATPSLLSFGGSRRVLAILPRDAAGILTSRNFAQAIGTPVTAVSGSDNNLMLCVEAEGLSLTHIAAEFVERRRDRVEFAGRVHCRTDIHWSPLIATSTTPESVEWGSAFKTQSSDAMSKTLVM